jgi:hypothetical protein
VGSDSEAVTVIKETPHAMLMTDDSAHGDFSRLDNGVAGVTKTQPRHEAGFLFG